MYCKVREQMGMKWKHILGLVLIFVNLMISITLFTACSQDQTKENSMTGTTDSSDEVIYSEDNTESIGEITRPADDAVPPNAEDDTEYTESELPPVQVEMPEYELSYSGEMKDLIVFEEMTGEDAGCLNFSVKLSVGEQTIFILRFNSDQSELVTVLTDAEGNRIPVAFEMMTLPEGLSNEDADLFYMAQDAVNEIVASLKLK